jgi:hypothetical protein
VIEDELLARQAAHSRHHRDRQDQSPAARRKVALPTAPHHRVAAIHQEAGPRVGSLIEVVAAGSVIEVAEQPFAAAIDYVIDQGSVAVRGHARAQDFDVGRRFDHPLRIARRAVDIDDDAVAGFAGRDGNRGAGNNAIIGADRAEGPAFERRRLDPNDFKF